MKNSGEPGEIGGAIKIPVNTGWETVANNRAFNLANTNFQTLPLVSFNDLNATDLLPIDTVVTFRVDMTGAVTTSSHAFNPDADQVYINGLPSGSFAAWDTSLPLLTNNPVGSKTYSIDVLIPKGSPYLQTYKYGINDGSDSIDNEAASANNHVRSIRGTGTFVMPLDTFGQMVVEPAFGNLTSTSSGANQVLISWLGGPGIHLQTSAALNNSWVDHPETDSLNSTNWPVSANALFFRLMKH